MTIHRQTNLERDPKDRIYLVKSEAGETIGGVGLVDVQSGKRTYRRWLAVCQKCGPIKAKGGDDDRTFLSQGEAAKAVKSCKHKQPLDRPLRMELDGKERDDEDDT